MKKDQNYCLNQLKKIKSPTTLYKIKRTGNPFIQNKIKK